MEQLSLFAPPQQPVVAASIRNYIRPQWVGERVSSGDTSTPEDAVHHWFTEVTALPIFDPQKEHLVVLMLNTRLRCVAWNLASIGSLRETVATPREIFRPAIAAAAFAIVLMHNHPSGDTSPSDGDHRVTVLCKQAADIIGIRLTDHVIVGNSATDRRFSFRESGLLAA